MEEQEKKTRRSSSAKESAPKNSTAKNSTKKVSTTSTAKKTKTEKSAATPKDTNKTTTKKEENKIKSTTNKKENIAPKVEKKPRKSTETKVSSDDKTNIGKMPKTEKIKEEKVSSSDKKTTRQKAKSTEEKDKVDSKKEIKKTADTKSSEDNKKIGKVVESKKTTNKYQTKDEQPKEQKQTEKSKKYIEISIGGIIAVIFIGLLIVLNITLGKWAYNMTKENNVTQNDVVDTDAEVEESIGTVLNNQNHTVNKLLEKIILPLNTTASIYQIGTFDQNTIPDDLILRIGWANLKEESKFHAKQATGESIIVVEKASMEESIKEIFGSEVKYKDVSFDNTNAKEFSKYAETQGIVAYDGETYTGVVNEIAEEGKDAFIYQELQKVVQYDNEIIILTKTAFINEENSEYVIYQNYNESFENRLMQIAPEELFKGSTFNKVTGEGSTAVTKNTALNGIRNELNTYKYTFAKDNTTGEYYLKEFGKENANV